MRRSAVAVVVAVVMLSTGLTVAAFPDSAGAGIAGSTVALPCTFSGAGVDDGQLAVDPGTGDLFVSCTKSDSVTVLSGSGQILQTLTGLGGPSGVAIHDGIAYIGLSSSGSIDAITISTLAVTTLATGLGAVTSVVWANGSVWTTSDQNLLEINPTDGAVTSWFVPNPDCSSYCTGLTGDPGNTSVLYLWDPGISSVTIDRIDVTGTPAVTAVVNTESSPNRVSIGNVEDVAVSPDGSSVVPAGGSPYQFDVLDAASLTPTGVDYPAPPYPTAIAMTAADQGLLATGTDGPSTGGTLSVFRLGDPGDVVASQALPGAGVFSEVIPQKVGFSPDGSDVYAVTAIGSLPGGPIAESLTVLPLGTQTVVPPIDTTTTITSTTRLPSIGQVIAVTVTVAAATPVGGEPTGQVTVSDGTRTSSPCGLNGSGEATCTITEPTSGTFTLNASYQGTTTFDPSSTTTGTAITVNKDLPSRPTIANLPSSGYLGGSFKPQVKTTGDGVTSVASSTGSVCTVTSGVVTFRGAGACVLTAQVTAGVDYLASTGTPQSFAVHGFTITTASLPTGVIWHSYGPVVLRCAGTGISAHGFTTTVSWAKVALPPGLTLSDAGVLAGTPHAATSTSVTVAATETVTTLKGTTKVKTVTTVRATIHLTIT